MNEVPKGLQTWVGYLSSLGLAVAAAVLTALNATDTTNLPPYVQLTLLIIGGLLTAVTSKNRSDQAVANTHALTAKQRSDGTWAIPPLPPADGET